MSEKPIHYEPHPVTPERKAELLAAGVRIVDSAYAPAGWKPETPKAKPKAKPEAETAKE